MQTRATLPLVRTARPADATALVALAQALLAHEYALNAAPYVVHPWAASVQELDKQLRQPETRFFVAETENQLVGYLKVVLHGRAFTRAELGWRRWSKKLLSDFGKRAFEVLLRRPRANVTVTGGYIAGAFVLPAWRRSHLGHALVAAAENWLRQNGMPTSELHVLYANPGAREFWASLGYEPLALGLRKKLNRED